MEERVQPSVEHSPATDPPRDNHSWVTRAIVTFLLGALGLVIVVWLVLKLHSLLVLLLVAFFISFAMEPAVAWLERRGWRRGMGTALVMLGILVFSVIMVLSVGRLLFDQAAQLVEQGPGLIQNAVRRTNEIFGTDLNAQRLSEAVADVELPIRDIATNVAGSALTVTTSVVGFIFNFFTIGLFAFYLTAEGPKVRRTVCSFFPPDQQRVVLRVWEVATEKTGGYLYSRLLLAAISATFAWAFFSIIGLPYAVPLGLWLGLTSQFIPTVGTYIGGALPVLIGLIESPRKALFVLIYILVYQQVENYLLSPRVTAHTMSLHPAVAFGSVVAGGALAGAVGALLALPAAAILQAVGSTYLRRHEVIETEMVSEAEPPARTERKQGPSRRFRRASS
jgi:predicted PurR-regulated permease PerM